MKTYDIAIETEGRSYMSQRVTSSSTEPFSFYHTIASTPQAAFYTDAEQMLFDKRFRRSRSLRPVA